jgi:hypothetical protein
VAGETSQSSVEVYWIPLGAGGAAVVRLSGRIYEAVKARTDRRRPLALLHTALEVRVPSGRFTIENAWPSPNSDIASRGVMVEGPVAHPRMVRFRPFRYEIRCWRDGVIPDAGFAVASPQLLSEDPHTAHRLLDSVSSVPPLTWGRDELGNGEMWNSNSVIAWLLVRSGLAADAIVPPPGARVPGWEAGIRVGDAERRTPDA